jgi:N utilization substance protein B
MKRRRAREYALQVLFQLEMSGSELNDKILEEFWEGKNEKKAVKDFTFHIVKHTLDHISEIDDLIQKSAQNWSMARMAVIDRSILRTATYELAYRADIPPSVTINEALEIAKKYSTIDSAPFINGILDKVAHTVSAAAKKS